MPPILARRAPWRAPVRRMCYPATVTDPTEARSVYPKHFFFQGSSVPPRKSGFILMPFALEFAPVYEAIEAAIEAAGYEAVRADFEKSNTRAVMEVILKGIAEAEFIVADVSRDSEGKENMNVYYEVGISHTVKENVILVAQDTDKLPFDSRHIPHIPYRLNDLPSFKDQLTEWIENLPAEPYPDYRRLRAPKSAVEMQREIRRDLTKCKQQWIESVIPSQEEVFQNNLAAQSSTSTTERMEKALYSIQSAFIKPWQRIESLGFQAIEQNKDTFDDMMRALSIAYKLPDSSPQSVAAYGPILALRTWALWGAYAIENENWDAVQRLLHKPVNIWGDQYYSLAEHRTLYHPYLVDNDAYIAANTIYQQSSNFAEQYFGDTESMKAFIGVWLFATDLIRALGDIRPVYPTWPYSPRNRFKEILGRVESDSDFSANFAKAVAGITPSQLNLNWESIREGMLAEIRRDIRNIAINIYIPDRFAL